jgi:hypothetical protein
MATELSNHFKYQCLKKQIDLSTDSIKVTLMAAGFTFNKDNHATYADVVASELASGNGYTQNTKVLTSQVLTEDDANDRGVMACGDVSWTASGGDIGPTPGAIFYDDTTSDNTIIGYLDFGGNQTATSGNILSIEDIEVRFN